MRARSDYDAVVIGGGPAGATAAVVLARAGWRVAVLERQRFPRRKVCGEFVAAPAWHILRGLGVADALDAYAGPVVRRVGLYAGDIALDAPMPRAQGRDRFGRAVAREHLDTLLLARARGAGADVLQPCKALAVRREGDLHVVAARDGAGEGERVLAAPVVIAAHGSWEPGALPTQVVSRARRASSLLAFKAHLRDVRLPPGTMPLVLFPGGYGGMVHTGEGRATLSCCIRRDVLTRCRAGAPAGAADARAGAAVRAHLESHCRGVARALALAEAEGAWLAAGPIRPGVRATRIAGIFTIGNAAGEAHPLIAEGIGMALQSAWLLAHVLAAHRPRLQNRDAPVLLDALAREYARAWRANFAPRIHASELFARLALNGVTRRAFPAVVRALPLLLPAGAWFSGKTRPLRVPSRSPLP